MTLTKLQAVALLLSTLGCAVIALCLVLGYFAAPIEGRLDPLAATVITVLLLTGTGIGAYLFGTSDLA